MKSLALPVRTLSLKQSGCSAKRTMPTEIISIPGIYEPVSSLSHLLGAVFFSAFSFFLLRRGRGNRLRVIGLAIFCSGTLLLLLTSGIYHSLGQYGDARALMRILDHAAIFVLIACTFTPIHIIVFRGWGRWGVLLLIWSIAIVAITLKTLYFDQMPAYVNLSLYLGMGWIGVFPGISMWRRYGFQFMQSMLWGGVAYSLGALLSSRDWPVLVPGIVQGHEVFHAAVLIGLGFHWAFIYRISTGRLPASSAACPSHVRSG